MSKITNDNLTRSASSCTNMARASRVNRAINIVHLSDRTTMSGTTGDVTAETSTMKSESSVTTSTSPVSTALSHSSEITDGLSQGWHLFILITLIARLLILLLARDSIDAELAIYPNSRPSFCLSVTRVDRSKTVEVRTVQFLPTVALSL